MVGSDVGDSQRAELGGVVPGFGVVRCAGPLLLCGGKQGFKASAEALRRVGTHVFASTSTSGGCSDAAFPSSRVMSSCAIAIYACAPMLCTSYRTIGFPKLGASASRTFLGTTVSNT